MNRGSWSTRNRASSRTIVGIASRVDVARRSAGTVRVVISRLTDARRPTARRLRTPTMASTTTTTADVRKIFEASRILGLFTSRESLPLPAKPPEPAVVLYAWQCTAD